MIEYGENEKGEGWANMLVERTRCCLSFNIEQGRLVYLLDGLEAPTSRSSRLRSNINNSLLRAGVDKCARAVRLSLCVDRISASSPSINVNRCSNSLRLIVERNPRLKSIIDNLISFVATRCRDDITRVLERADESCEKESLVLRC